MHNMFGLAPARGVLQKIWKAMSMRLSCSRRFRYRKKEEHVDQYCCSMAQT